MCGNNSWLFDQVTLSSFFPRCELGLKNLINSQLSLIRWLLQAWGWGDGDPLVWTWQLLQQKGALPYSSQPWQTSGHRKLKQTSMENKKKKKEICWYSRFCILLSLSNVLLSLKILDRSFVMPWCFPWIMQCSTVHWTCRICLWIDEMHLYRGRLRSRLVDSREPLWSV